MQPDRPPISALSTSLLLLAVLALSAVGCITLMQGCGRSSVSVEFESVEDLKESTQRVLTFKAERLEMEPEEAAAQWLEMTIEGMNQDYGPIDFTTYLSVLPGPDAWPALAEQIDAMPADEPGDRKASKLVLKILADTLLNDQEAAKTSLSQLEQHIQTMEPTDRGRAQSAYQALDAAVNRSAISSDLTNPKSREQVLANAVTQYKGVRDLEMIRVPRLVGAIGEEQTRAFFQKAMTQPVVLDFNGADEATKQVGRAVLVELGDRLAAPQWSLVGGEDTIELYELLGKRYGLSSAKLSRSSFGLSWRMQEQHRDAESRYLAALLRAGLTSKFKAAIVRETAAQDTGFSHYNNARLFGDKAMMKQAWPIVQELIDEQATPSPALYDLYSSLGTALGEYDVLAVALDKVLTEKAEYMKSRPEVHTKLLVTRYEAMLNADRVDAAVAALRDALAKWPVGSNRSSSGNPGQTLAELGRLLDEPKWIDEGITWMLQPAWGIKYYDEVAAMYEKAGRHKEAERMLLGLVKQRGVDIQGARYGGYDDASYELTKLGAFYHRVGRDADALKLLESASGWGASDLSEFITQNNAGEEMAELTTGAANALAADGRSDVAVPILRAMLSKTDDEDPLYESFITILGEDALEDLDAMYKRNQFEERPLIWKAELLNRLERYEDAAEVAKKAISIDPSDGDQGKGDRMRVYAVLADALAGLGNADDAAFYREVVAAIRMSEDADDFYRVGLEQKAADMYRASLTRFADAYCIQSRLAIRLYRMGRHEEAAEHFRKAFELMPDSFGRVESHCFGCEGVFSSNLAQSIAEEVFVGLIEEQPDKPQVHYLMGYLRGSQGLNEVALKHYRRAIELDPDYVNAWRKISYEPYPAMMSVEEREEVAFNLLRLDLDSVLEGSSTKDAYDLARVWRLAQQALDSQYQVPASLLPLGPKPKPGEESRDEFEQDLYDAVGISGQADDPAAVIAQHRVAQALERWLSR